MTVKEEELSKIAFDNKESAVKTTQEDCELNERKKKKNNLSLKKYIKKDNFQKLQLIRRNL